jgi:microcystin-dependent protein
MEGVIGYITGFAGNFAPKNWAFCQGQIINISSNTALFSILGTVYGGNGTTTFGLPDLRGRVIVGQGQGPGLSAYSLGQVGGAETNTVSTMQMPAHVHPVAVVAYNNATDNDASVTNPVGGVWARDTAGIDPYANGANVNMASWPATIQMAPVGGNSAFNSLRPLIGINYVVCLYGVYPARN